MYPTILFLHLIVDVGSVSFRTGIKVLIDLTIIACCPIQIGHDAPLPWPIPVHVYDSLGVILSWDNPYTLRTWCFIFNSGPTTQPTHMWWKEKKTNLSQIQN